VLGDEGAGVVEEVGPCVEGLTPGDPVIRSWAPTCGRCHYCVIGRPNLCERRQPGRGVLPDGTTRMSLRGRPVYSADPDLHSLAWSARGFVYTVIAEAPPATVDQVVGALPHDAGPGFWGRIARGLRRLVGMANPFR